MEDFKSRLMSWLKIAVAILIVIALVFGPKAAAEVVGTVKGWVTDLKQTAIEFKDAL